MQNFAYFAYTNDKCTSRRPTLLRLMKANRGSDDFTLINQVYASDNATVP